jgi:hypothetical protein
MQFWPMMECYNGFPEIKIYMIMNKLLRKKCDPQLKIVEFNFSCLSLAFNLAVNGPKTTTSSDCILCFYANIVEKMLTLLFHCLAKYV